MEELSPVLYRFELHVGLKMAPSHPQLFSQREIRARLSSARNQERASAAPCAHQFRIPGPRARATATRAMFRSSRQRGGPGLFQDRRDANEDGLEERPAELGPRRWRSN